MPSLHRVHLDIYGCLFNDFAARFSDVDLQLAVYGLDVNFTVFRNIGQEDTQAERHCQESFDGAA